MILAYLKKLDFTKKVLYQDLLHLDKGCQEGIPPYIPRIKKLSLVDKNYGSS
jgi:hypothetical protein